MWMDSRGSNVAFACFLLAKVSKRMLSDTVTDENIAEVVSRATGIPIGTLLQGEVSLFFNLARMFHFKESRRTGGSR
jgi:ATP-dependent Clp protease ATP-binding subunit ClpA